MKKKSTFVCHFTFLCTVDVMLIRYVLWEFGKDVLSFGVDHLVQKSGHLRHIDLIALISSSAKYATKQRIQKDRSCPSVLGPARTLGQTGK